MSTVGEVFGHTAACLRQQTPLVHHITSAVVAQMTADVTLAVGASPMMAQAPQDVEEVVKKADAVVLNLGMVTGGKLSVMRRAREVAAAEKTPVVFDPVGAGFTSYRSRLAEAFVQPPVPEVIRGNSSEIASVAGLNHAGRGVDGTGDHCDLSIYRQLARRRGTVVAATGPEDIVTDGDRTFIVRHGDKMMTAITGSGCMVTSVLSVFVSLAEEQILLAAAAAMAFCGLAGERAAEEARGPGDFRTRWINQMREIIESPQDAVGWNVQEVDIS